MRITPGEVEATVAKIEKINARAARKGFTGRLSVDTERVEVTTTNDLGFEVTEVLYDVTITGEPPRYNGWTLLAVLDWDSEAGLIVRTAPGVESVGREGLREGWCDHCRTNRDRAKTYLVGSDDGGQVQVGSTCIKDYLGWQGAISFISEHTVQDEIETFLGGGGYVERRWPVPTVLAAAWAAIQVYGWQPASSYGATTKDVVYKVLDPRTKWDREEVAALRPYLERSYAQAAIVRAWVGSEAFSGRSEYVTNLKQITAAEHATGRSIGFLASAPQAWAKAQERDLTRRAEQGSIVNEFVGAVKDKLELDVTIKSIRYVTNDYGTATVYTLLGADNHLYNWYATRGVLGETADDTVYRITGTVKRHDEYQGRKSTVLTRCKVKATMEVAK